MTPTAEQPEGEKSAMTIPELARRVGRARQLLHRLASKPDESWPAPIYPGGTTRPHYDVAAFDAYWEARESSIGQGKRTDLEKKRATEPSASGEGQPMGYDQKRILITTRLSRHNSEQDRTDDALFDELADRIREVLTDKRFESIEPYIDSPY